MSLPKHRLLGGWYPLGPIQGRIQDFKLWGRTSCEKSRFYATLRGACAGCAPPPGSALATVYQQRYRPSDENVDIKVSVDNAFLE